MYGSPFGGANMTTTPQPTISMRMPEALLERPDSSDVPYEQDLDLRMRARIINDILGGKINLDELMQLPDMQSPDSSQGYFKPMA